MDTEVRQFVNAALRSYDQGRNSAYRRLNSAILHAMGLDEAEARQLMDDAWRAYVDDMQEAGAPFSLMLERLAR